MTEQTTAARPEGASEADWLRIWTSLQRLRPYSRRLAGGRHADAEDLLQQTLLRAMAALHRGATHADDMSWLAHIMRNLAIDEWRRRERLRQGRETYAVDLESLCVTHPPAPDGGVAEVELKRALERAMARLPVDLAETLRMRTVDEMEYADIAQRARRSEAAVRKRFQTARQRLRRELQAIGY